MGEARRRREAKAAREAAYRLGGEPALKELIEPGETVECPICDRGLTGPVSPGYPRGAQVICSLCKGKGGIRRSTPKEDGSVRFLDFLSCIPLPRRY